MQGPASHASDGNESFTQYAHFDESATVSDERTITDDFDQDATVMNEPQTQVEIKCTFGDEEKIVNMTSNEVYLGRSQNNDISFVKDVKLSRRHASLKMIDGRLILSDEKSVNGTYLNGEMITGSVEVGNDSNIRIGATTLKITISGGM
jgi:pSer/pThr/pTyr-binding forkhead associated (FHA) protein